MRIETMQALRQVTSTLNDLNIFMHTTFTFLVGVTVKNAIKKHKSEFPPNCFLNYQLQTVDNFNSGALLQFDKWILWI
jgi:hypothetical protein